MSGPRHLPRLAVATLLLAFATVGCKAHEHIVGAGPEGLGQTSARQYHILFGLFRLNEVNSQSLAGDRTAYEIVTEQSFTDVLLFPLLLPFTVTTRTVTVYR